MEDINIMSTNDCPSSRNNESNEYTNEFCNDACGKLLRAENGSWHENAASISAYER